MSCCPVFRDHYRGNDYFANADTASTVNNLISSIKSILDYSPDNQVRYFLIPNLPDLSKTPYGADPAHVGLNLAEKTAAHNSLLQQQIASEITSNPQYKDKVVIMNVDVATAFAEATSHPAEYGFTNVTDACYKGSYMPGDENTDCGDGAHYIFWDNIHPTTQAHCIVTKAALQAMGTANLLAKPDVIANFKCD